MNEKGWTLTLKAWYVKPASSVESFIQVIKTSWGCNRFRNFAGLETLISKNVMQRIYWRNHDDLWAQAVQCSCPIRRCALRHGVKHVKL